MVAEDSKMALQRAVEDAHREANELGSPQDQMAGKYLTFFLDKEEYGLQILKVREIMGMLDVTKVPQTASFVLGVINLRGKVIPVIDLRLRFGLPFREADQRTCIIVVAVQDDSGTESLMSLKVDQVSEVANIGSEDVETTPAFGSEMDSDYIMGMAKVGGRVKILLDINRIINSSQLVVG